MNGTNDTEQFVQARSIQNATHHACVQREKRRVVGRASCDRNNPSGRAERAHLADRVDPRHATPAQVHQSDIGLMTTEATDGVGRITCFANHIEICLSSYRPDQSFANETMCRDIDQTDCHR